jgi:hypothetical protein
MAIRKISVPKVPKSSYDPDRPISGLLKAQIAMLEEANLSHDPTMVVRDRAPKTEGQAARYIHELHSTLREHLKKKAADQNALSPTALRAALGPRSTSTPDGSKRWPATAGPSAAARQRGPVVTKQPKAKKPKTVARKQARKRKTR